MPTTPVNCPLVLIVRDGWGENPHPEHDPFNAVKLARTPVDARLRATCPWTLIRTSGEDVGLPAGTPGNSEVGHQNIGAGRVVDQESVRITKACRSGAIGGLPAIAESLGEARARAGAYVHFLCIASDAGVHGQLDHLYALLAACREAGVERVAVHLFTDGRDTGPFTGLGYVREVEAEIGAKGTGVIASVIGRYWGMDRDHRWERVARAWRCLTGRGVGTADGSVRVAASAEEAVQRAYDHPEHESQRGDEFVPPTMVGAGGLAGCARTRIKDGDTVVFVNYRGDRPRELVSAFVLPDDAWAAVKPSPDTGARGFDRGARMALTFVTMTAYSEALAPYVRVVFPKPARMTGILGAHLSALGVRQFRCAETEKYPHVTFFFNDYRDDPYPGERRENPQSPRVATYDLAPAMAAHEVRDAVLRRVRAPDAEGLIVVNFANCDMVGHTGNLGAAVRAVEVTDECVGAIIDAAVERGGSAIVTADHGNAEQMFDPATNAPHTAHTVYDVPLYVVGRAFAGRRLRAGGRLADIAPTVLAMMGMPVPPEMTGVNLLSD